MNIIRTNSPSGKALHKLIASGEASARTIRINGQTTMRIEVKDEAKSGERFSVELEEDEIRKIAELANDLGLQGGQNESD